MKTEVRLITPELAAEWLERNKVNREWRPHRTAEYARIMQAGAWILTHQGILLDVDGNLVDGQHRLTAIVDTGITVKMMVSHLDVSITAMAIPVDNGLTRTYSDILSIPRKHIEVIRLTHEIACGVMRNGRISANEVAAVYEVLRPRIEALPTPVHSAMCAHRVATILAGMIATERAQQIHDQASWFTTGSNCTQWWSSVEAFGRFCKQAKRQHWHGISGRMDYVMRWRMAMLQPDLKISRITNEVLLAREIKEQCKDILTSAGVRYESN